MDFTHIDIEIEKFLKGKNISVTDNPDEDRLNPDRGDIHNS
ncbi:hypothetical protein J2X31_001612 [Flavobacterium arsenatis]|uniref:Uncharacterized protein n=1 Tax=Flavobacterium arsenatis TaxID=1484332 RepID=A0ABU1TNR5_9FLAO|nr:hypothetical protein [Flavobacterium arsenatis]